ncbi:MAG TPA: hypothetical protein VHQ65_13475, partial [Thermoanaerobaculia bacterium]|nr:hypothetical protein [Thermoanaerobaculia bacterium]
MIRHVPAASAAVLGGLVLWAPLPFGSVRPVAETALAVGACVALLLALPAIQRRRSLAPVALPAAALAALALIASLQALPWPQPLAAVVSPQHARLAAAAGEVAEG